MTRTTGAAVALIAGLVLAGCSPASAAPQTAYAPVSGPWRPVAVSEPTGAPTAPPGPLWGHPPAPPRVVPQPTAATGRVVRGIASRMGLGFPPSYLALPGGRGATVTVCGAGGCATIRSTDAGPDLAMQRAGRVADLSDAVWARVCGLPLSAGLCRVSVEYR